MAAAASSGAEAAASSGALTTTVIGGLQSPKTVLDAVMTAVMSSDLFTLRELMPEFLAYEENLVKCTDSSGNGIVHLAVMSSSSKELTTLALVVEKYGADVNAVNLHGKTPLHLAVRNNNVGATRYLLEHGAKDVCFSNTFSTPFHTAASCGSLECIEVLLQFASGGDDKKMRDKVNEVDSNMCTALHKCAYDGGGRVTEWLLDHQINFNAQDKHGSTALIIAVKMGREDICDLLIRRGADPTKADETGNTPLHYCASRCMLSITQLLLERLLERRAPIAVANEGDYNTPLHVAALHMKPDSPEWNPMVIELIRAGRQELLDAKNAAGKTAKEYVPRAVQPLFTMDTVLRQTRERQTKEQKAVEKARDAAELREEKIAEQRKIVELQRQRLAEEEALRHREAEERFRHEEDARIRAEEEAEQKRLEEEEAKKAKKGGGGGAKPKK